MDGNVWFNSITSLEQCHLVPGSAEKGETSLESGCYLFPLNTASTVYILIFLFL